MALDVAFEPVKAFTLIDRNKDGMIDTEDVVSFMKQQYIKISEEDAALILKEFDSDLDGALSFEEFSQFTLPSTD